VAEPSLTPPLRPSRAAPPLRATSVVAALVVGLVVIAALLLRGPAVEPVASSSPSLASAPDATAAAVASSSVRPTPAIPVPSFPAPGRMDVPWQPGAATHAMIVVDASTVDEATAAWIRHGLVDLVEQLPDYDSLTLLASSDAVRLVVDNATLDGQARDAAIAAIEKLEFGGTRRLVAGVEGVVQQAVKAGPGPAYETLIIATGSDGTTVDQLRTAAQAPSNANGSSNVGFHLHGVAIGAGDHEALLSRLGGTYQWARTGADLSLALAPFRLAISEATLLAIGPVPADGQAAKALVGPFHFGVRFTTYSPGRSVGFELVAPNGRTVDVNAHQEDVTVQEFGDRISIVVNGIDGGDWQVQFKDSDGSYVGAWFEVEETGTLSYPLLTAYGTGDTTNELKLGVGLPEGATYTASARIVAADGTEQSVALGSLKQGDLNIGGAIEIVGAIVERPTLAGSYRIYLSADYTDATDQRHVYSWLLGAYVAVLRDSDGDGITDSVEEHNSMDPHDPADGALDDDHDGLTTSQELATVGSDPREWDTDFGGESDGSEVDAGRNPLDRADDVPAKTCLQMIPTPAPGATPTPESRETAPPAPELAALLPNDILGYRTQKVSMTAPKKLEYIFAVFDAFLACTNKQRTDLSLAIAVANDLRGWSVTAVRVDGVTGQEMADIFLYRMTNGPTGGLIQERAVDGRTYSLSEVGWAVYATDDTFYWIAQLGGGDFAPPNAGPTPSPPASIDVVEAIIRQLPLDH
jgi:von Willebrand factor type A domain